MHNITLSYLDTTSNHKEKTLSFSADLLQEAYNEASLFVSKVNGQSMQPTIFHESLVVADLSNKKIEEGRIYLLHYENNMWIKQAKFDTDLNTFTFVSINPQYAHLVYKENEVHVIARVLLTFTSL